MQLIILMYKFYLMKIILIFTYLQYDLELEALVSVFEINALSFREEEM